MLDINFFKEKNMQDMNDPIMHWEKCLGWTKPDQFGF